MSNQLMREQFEEAWSYARRNDEGVPGPKPLRSLTDPERYRGEAVNFAWTWWQRSREALVVSLPDTEWFGDSWSGGWAMSKENVVDALEEQGLKVTP